MCFIVKLDRENYFLAMKMMNLDISNSMFVDNYV